MDQQKPNTPKRRKIVAILKRTGRIVSWALAIVVLLLLLVILLPQSRGVLLNKAIKIAGNSLPGQMSVEHAKWPALGRLEIDNLLWSDQGDTLASVNSIQLALDISDLLHRDVVVRHAGVSGVVANVPLIQNIMPSVDEPKEKAPQKSSSFPRAGSLPTIPSIAINRLAMIDIKATTAPAQSVYLDSLTVSLDLLQGHDPTAEFMLQALPVAELGISWRGKMTSQGDSLILDLATISAAEPARLINPANLPYTGQLHLATAILDSLAKGNFEWPTLSMKNLSVVGDIGSWSINANLAGNQPGCILVSSKLPVAPVALMSILAKSGADTLGTGLLDTLSSRWSMHKEPGLQLDISFLPPPSLQSPAQTRVEIIGDIILPAPAALEPLLPTKLNLADLGSIVAHVNFVYDGFAQKPEFVARLDLSQTSWLDSGLVLAHGDTSAVSLDSLQVSMPGLALFGAGKFSRQEVQFGLQLNLPDATLLQRWQDPALADIEYSVSAKMDVAGALPLPSVNLTSTAAIKTPLATVPAINVTATITPDTLNFSADLPQGLQHAQQNLNQATVSFNGATADSLRQLRGNLRLNIDGEQADLLLDGYLRSINLQTAPSGSFTGDTIRVVVDNHDLVNTRPWQTIFSAADSTLIISGLDLTGDLGRIQLEATANADSISANLALNLKIVLDTLRSFLPPKNQALLPDGTLTITGNVKSAGSLPIPWAVGELSLAIENNPDLANLKAQTNLTISGTGKAPASIPDIRKRGQHSSAYVNMSLADGDTLLTNISALLPLPTANSEPDSVELRLDTNNLNLARLQPLLPAGIELAGYLNSDAKVFGLMAIDQTDPDLNLAGGLDLSELQFALSDGSWMAMDGSVQLAGSSLAPVVRGGLEIQGGLLRLPEPPPVLLPTKGEPLLWAATNRDSSTTIDNKETLSDSTTVQKNKPTILPDLLFAIKCPGSLWLRGQGLDVELAGDMSLRVREGLPAMEGELEAVQGTMKQLGHIFKLERGRILFYADETELDPELDLALGVNINPYHIQIFLTGTANEPKLRFASTPELSDGDIIGTLLFGKPMDELDEGQAGLLADRAGQIAVAYGAMKLQESLAKELGVDVLTIAPSEGDSESNALTVGKYLNPKIMVRYEQLLNDYSTFLVHLDYNFIRNFKLHTQVSQGDNSGVEVKWEKSW